MAISKEQQRELKNLARAANRRLERASEGQRSALQYYIKDYHTTKGKYGKVFSQAAATTEREYKQRMVELQKFMAAKTSRIKPWKALQQSNVEKAQETLSKMGFSLSEEELAKVLSGKAELEKQERKKLQELKNLGEGELAAILKETKARTGQLFYKALEILQAQKTTEGELSDEDIKNALADSRTDYEVTLALLQNRNV